MRRYIGLSLSLCLKDILNGKIEVSEVSCIVTNTAFDTYLQAFNHYYSNYWASYDEAVAFKTLLEVWPLVCQPRRQVGMAKHSGHYVNKGWWIDTLEGIVVNL